MAKLNQELIDLIDSIDGNVFDIHVTPKASAEKIILRSNSDNTLEIRVYITVVPEGGKANKAVISLLSKSLGIAKTSIKIVRGQNARTKTISLY